MKQHTVEYPLAVAHAASHPKAMKKAAAPVKMTVSFPYFTNDEAILQGTPMRIVTPTSK